MNDLKIKVQVDALILEAYTYKDTGSYHDYEQIKRKLPAMEPKEYERTIRLISEIIGV